jgi:hypothetical protein
VDNEERAATPATIADRLQQLAREQAVRRFTGGLNTNWRPLPWLSVVTQGGIDGCSVTTANAAGNTVRSSALNLLGFRGSNRAQFMNYNLGAGGTGSAQPDRAHHGQTSAGVQFQRELFERTDAFGRQLLPGTTPPAGTSAQFAVDELYEDNRTIGAYLQQQFGFATASS